MSPGSSKENTDKPKKSSKKPSRSVWTVPTEKLWKRGSSSTTLPLYNPPPSTPIKGTSISKLKEMNGWKWRGGKKTTFKAYYRKTLCWRTGRAMVSHERATGASSCTCLLKINLWDWQNSRKLTASSNSFLLWKGWPCRIIVMKIVFIKPNWHAKGQNTLTWCKNKQHPVPSKAQYEHSCLKHLSNPEDRQHATKEHTQHELGDGSSDKPLNWLEDLWEEPIGRCFISPKYINCLKKCSSGESLCLLASVCQFPLFLFVFPVSWRKEPGGRICQNYRTVKRV